MLHDGVCPQEPDVEKLENKINCGQIEEVIFQVGAFTHDALGAAAGRHREGPWSLIASWDDMYFCCRVVHSWILQMASCLMSSTLPESFHLP